MAIFLKERERERVREKLKKGFTAVKSSLHCARKKMRSLLLAFFFLPKSLFVLNLSDIYLIQSNVCKVLLNWPHSKLGQHCTVRVLYQFWQVVRGNKQERIIILIISVLGLGIMPANVYINQCKPFIVILHTYTINLYHSNLCFTSG